MGRPLVGETVTSKKNIHDVLLWELEQRYCREPIELTEGEYEIGEVIAGATLGASSVGAVPEITDAICLEGVTIPSGETWEVKALARGPALVNMDEIVKATEDETDAALRTRLANLCEQGIKFVREPVVQSTPDTSA